MRKAKSNRYRRFTVTLLALAAVSPLTVVALADTLELTNGRSLDGNAVVRENGDVELHSSMGMIVIPAAKVERVTKSQTIEEQVLDELLARPNVTADDLFELGDEARRGGASTLAKKLFSEAIRLDPEHEASRLALGYYRTDKGWRTGPPSVSTKARRSVEQAERVALLRALRAQANAARLAELQRQVFLVTQTALANAAAARSGVIRNDHFSDGHTVQRVIPIVPAVSHGFGPVPPRASTGSSLRSPAKRGPVRTVEAPPKSRRRPRVNTIVRVPPP